MVGIYRAVTLRRRSPVERTPRCAASPADPRPAVHRVRAWPRCACATEAAPARGPSFDGDERPSIRPVTSAPRSTSRSRPTPGSPATRHPRSDQVVEAALADVDAFWSRTYEDLYGEPYQPISGGFWPYGPDTEQPPCGDRRPPTATSPATPSTARRPTSSRGTTSTSSQTCTSEFGGLHPRHRVRPRVRSRDPGTRVGDRRDPRSCWSSRPTASPARGRRDVEAGNSEHFDARPSTTSTRPWPASSRSATASAPSAAEPRRPRHRLRPHRRLRGGLRAGRGAVRRVPGRVRRRRPGDRRGALHRPGRLRPRRQPPARPAPAAPRDDLENFWTSAFEAARRDLDADHRRRHGRSRRRRGGVRRHTYRGDDLERGPSTASTPTPSTSTGSNLIPRLEPDRRLRRRHGDRPPVRLRRPGPPRDLDNTPSPATSRPTASPACYARSGFVGDRRGPGTGPLPVAGRPRRGRDRVPPQQRRQRGRRGRRRRRSGLPSSASTPTGTGSWRAPPPATRSSRGSRQRRLAGSSRLVHHHAGRRRS